MEDDILLSMEVQLQMNPFLVHVLIQYFVLGDFLCLFVNVM